MAQGLLLLAYHTARRTPAMHSDRIEIVDDSTAETPGFDRHFHSFAAPPASAAAAREPTPIGFFTLGIAWLFGLEALLADERR
jgi:hypothetical protein